MRPSSHFLVSLAVVLGALGSVIPTLEGRDDATVQSFDQTLANFTDGTYAFPVILLISGSDKEMQIHLQALVVVLPSATMTALFCRSGLARRRRTLVQ